MLDHIPKELTSVSDDHKTPSTRVLKFSSMHSNAHHHPELEKNLETRVTITSKPSSRAKRCSGLVVRVEGGGNG